ncbi:MAG: XRE family transcriptional regulator [Muribaculaceae bacterium]|nr:XRE family transcriptional regulator [Muribaculaceae bacterium]
MAIHIGKEIKAELHRQERGVSWLAEKLHCDRTNVYNIFKRQGIDTRLLERISIILNRNFFALYCQEDSIEDENISIDV